MAATVSAHVPVLTTKYSASPGNIAGAMVFSKH
jgi:hypothetical protein